MNPAADDQLRTFTVDLTSIQEGQSAAFVVDSEPIFVRHRTEAEIATAVGGDLSLLRDPERDSDRTLNPKWLVVVGACTRSGCVVHGNKDGQNRGEYGGWFCPCCASHYDTSGRIRTGIAPKNLRVPDYEILNDVTLLFRSPPRPTA